MHPILKVVLAVLAVVAGLVLGGALNMGLIVIGPNIIPPPEGADMTTMEGLKSAMEILSPRHFIFPWLAHALGTLLGAFVAAKLTPVRPMVAALIVGLLFFWGGVDMVDKVGGPLWFIIADLAGAYFPMAWLGGKLATRTAATA